MTCNSDNGLISNDALTRHVDGVIAHPYFMHKHEEVAIVVLEVGINPSCHRTCTLPFETRPNPFTFVCADRYIAQSIICAIEVSTATSLFPVWSSKCHNNLVICVQFAFHLLAGNQFHSIWQYLKRIMIVHQCAFLSKFVRSCPMFFPTGLDGLGVWQITKPNAHF